MRERAERGLDPGEADRPDDGRMLSFDPSGYWPEAHKGWTISYAWTSLER